MIENLEHENLLDISAEDNELTTSRRHPPSSKIRLDGRPTSPTLLESTWLLPGVGGRSSRPVRPGALTDELRANLWGIVANALAADQQAPSSTACLRRVWASRALGGDIGRIPDDAIEVIAGWFSLVEPADVYAFIESVFDNVDPAIRPAFATSINAALERGHADHRFVMRKLLPIVARADVSTIERGMAACKATHLVEPERHLCLALACLANKPRADVQGAIHHAVRTVELAASTITGAMQSLEQCLERLEELGYIGSTLKNAYAGVFTYVGNEAHRPTIDDARVVVVMSAGFVSHIARMDGAEGLRGLGA
jgi:hypothetical protein